MKILLADDDAIIRQVLLNLLGKWGYDAVPTSNGAEAWEMVQNDDSLRIALLDWFMPEINGMELTRRIREANITPFYIILITARGAKESLIEALDAGADDFVSKPFDREILQARLKVAIRTVELQSYLIRRIADAESSVGNLKELRPFITVCSMCQKIKDMHDEWHKAELPAELTTEDPDAIKICPECSEKVEKAKAQA